MAYIIRAILVVLGIYFIGKAIFRGLLSFLFGKSVNNMNAQMRQQQEEMARQKKKQEGKVTINYQPKPDKNFGKNEGDYVDFEEVG